MQLFWLAPCRLAGGTLRLIHAFSSDIGTRMT